MIVGFSFTKINAEKLSLIKGKIDINNNVTIKNVEQADFSLGKKKQDALKFIFEFASKYEPSIGSISFEGEIIYVSEPKSTKEILDAWSKEKKIEKDLMASILNTILTKCNVQALILSQEINLPPPIPMPKVNISAPSGNTVNNEKGYIG